MKTQDAVTPIINNNYSGVKIDIHNPTVNVPSTQGYAKPDVQIYNYEQKKIPADYYQQVYAPKQENKKPKIIAVPQIPDPKPVTTEPESVLKEVKTVPVPEPVFVEITTPEAQKTEVVNTTINEPIKIDEKPVEIIENSEPQSQKDLPQTVITETVPTVNEEKKVEVVPVKEPVTEVTKQPIEIIPPVDIKPAIDRKQVAANLKNPDYDVQALQLKDIVDAGLNPDKNAVKPYVIEQVFLSVIDLVNVDSTKLAGPTEAQLQIRTKIMENMLAAEQQQKANVPNDQLKLPHQISEQDFLYANSLSDLELAERNKSYAITALAILSNEFLKQVEAETGNIVPITDVPGLSAIVNTLKTENYNVKLTAIDALTYIQRPEYARELSPIYTALINTDTNEIVRRAASEALARLQNIQPKTVNAA